jgi:hypothetical protein
MGRTKDHCLSGSYVLGHKEDGCSVLIIVFMSALRHLSKTTRPAKAPPYGTNYRHPARTSSDSRVEREKSRRKSTMYYHGERREKVDGKCKVNFSAKVPKPGQEEAVEICLAAQMPLLNGSRGQATYCTGKLVEYLPIFSKVNFCSWGDVEIDR